MECEPVVYKNTCYEALSRLYRGRQFVISLNQEEMDTFQLNSGSNGIINRFTFTGGKYVGTFGMKGTEHVTDNVEY